MEALPVLCQERHAQSFRNFDFQPAFRSRSGVTRGRLRALRRVGSFGGVRKLRLECGASDVASDSRSGFGSSDGSGWVVLLVWPRCVFVFVLTKGRWNCSSSDWSSPTNFISSLHARLAIAAAFPLSRSPWIRWIGFVPPLPWVGPRRALSWKSSGGASSVLFFLGGSWLPLARSSWHGWGG